MRRVFIAIGLVLLFLVGTNIQILAQEIHVCIDNRDGKIRVVSGPEECNPKRETHMFWNQIGPQGPQGETGPQGEPGPQGPEGPPGQGCVKAYSANDELVGILLATSVHPSRNQVNIFVLEPINYPTILNLESGQIIGGTVRFESSDCTGIPYANRADSVFVVGSLLAAGPRRYFRAVDAQIRRQFNSKLIMGWDADCRPDDLDTFQFPAIEISEDEFPFTPPWVALPLRYEVQME